MGARGWAVSPSTSLSKRLPRSTRSTRSRPKRPCSCSHLPDRAILNARQSGRSDTTAAWREIVRDAGGIRPACCWPSRTPAFSMRRWPSTAFRVPSSIRRAISCQIGWALPAQSMPAAALRTIRRTTPLSSRSWLKPGSSRCVHLFTQKPKKEKADFLTWTRTSQYKQGDDYFRHNGAGKCDLLDDPDSPTSSRHGAGDGGRAGGGDHSSPKPLALALATEETISRALDVFER